MSKVRTIAAVMAVATTASAAATGGMALAGGNHKAGSGTGGKSTNNCLQLVVSIVNGAISGVALTPTSCGASANGTGGAAHGKKAAY